MSNNYKITEQTTEEIDELKKKALQKIKKLINIETNKYMINKLSTNGTLKIIRQYKEGYEKYEINYHNILYNHCTGPYEKETFIEHYGHHIWSLWN